VHISLNINTLKHGSRLTQTQDVSFKSAWVQPRSRSWGVQFLGLGYYTEQNTDGVPSFVDCSLLRNGNHTLHQKTWDGPSNFFLGGPDPLTPQWLRPCKSECPRYGLVRRSRDAVGQRRVHRCITETL